MNKIRFGKTPAGEDPVYMGPSEGPFKCSNCEYYKDPNMCNKKEMIKGQNQSPAAVHPDGCCNYYEKK